MIDRHLADIGAGTAPACRIYGHIARDGRSAVLLRRGPTRQVQLIRWWLGSDTFEPGQWLKGRIYERRCDLSPDGALLCYFAQNFGRAPGSWTAISRPPYLTALAMWAKGDCWGGGGLFQSRSHVRLNHRPGGEFRLYPGYRLAKTFRVEPLGDHSGWGENDPIERIRLLRDGWRVTQNAHASVPPRFQRDAFDLPELLSRQCPARADLNLFRILRGFDRPDGPFYQYDHAVLPTRQWDNTQPASLADLKSKAVCYMPDCGWADWSSDGDLLHAVGGCLYRTRPPRKHHPKSDWPAPRLLADFSNNRFRECRPPLAATRW